MLFHVCQTVKCISIIVTIDYSSIAYGHQNPVSCSPISDYEGFSTLKVVKKGYTSMIFTVLLLYKKSVNHYRHFMMRWNI